MNDPDWLNDSNWSAAYLMLEWVYLFMINDIGTNQNISCTMKCIKFSEIVMQTDHQIQTRRPELVLINKN